MLFQSFEFLFFFPIVVISYFLLPIRYRWFWLLVASYFFYAYWNVYYIVLIIASTLTDYIVALNLEKTTLPSKRKQWLGLSILINLGLLFFFKYFDFASANIEQLGKLFDPSFQSIYLNLILPIGISFYTFQTLGYTIDVYRGNLKAERHLGKFALYVAFFPQLVAGPIEKAKFLLSQFHFNYHFDYTRIVHGLRLMLWGFFKKLVIADRLGLYVHQVFDFPDQHSGPIIWIAAGLFTLQLYYDFSAYQDIAVGIAKIMGINLSQNFVRRAYYVTSFTKMWQGWHITLTRWIREYIYYPLIRHQSGRIKSYWITILVMMLMGLWHGANWTFIVWGLLNGIILVIERFFRKKKLFKIKGKFLHFLYAIFTFSAISFTLIFFRANTVSDSLNLMIQSFDFSVIYFQPNIFFLDFYLIFIFVFFFDWWMRQMKDKPFEIYMDGLVPIVRWGIYTLFILAILFMRIPKEVQFIYFEF